MCPDLRAVSVMEEIASPELQESAKKPSSVPAKTSAPKQILPASSSSTPASSANMGPPFYSTPQGQYKCFFLLEDESVFKHVLKKVLQMSVPVMVKDICTVALEFCKQFHKLTTTKHIVYYDFLFSFPPSLYFFMSLAVQALLDLSLPTSYVPQPSTIFSYLHIHYSTTFLHVLLLVLLIFYDILLSSTLFS